MDKTFAELQNQRRGEKALKWLQEHPKDLPEPKPDITADIASEYTPEIDRELKALKYRISENAPKETGYAETEENLAAFERLFGEIGGIYLRANEDRDFETDEANRGLIRLLIAYQLKWKDTFSECFRLFTDRDPVSLFAPLLLVGDRGVGKTLLLVIASEFARITGNPGRTFLSTSASELLNHFRVRSNIDRYTYNTEGTKAHGYSASTAKPLNVCFNDLGIESDDKANVFGTSIAAIVKDFLLARYEIYQNTGTLCHVTTNLGIPALRKLYPERITDRFSQYNVIPVLGKSRRRR